MSARSRGFTLIESLIGLVILSIGLLGAVAMLLGSLRTHADALRRVAATSLVRDMAERIRMNPHARAQYDTRAASADLSSQLAAADRAHFAAAARALFPHAAYSAEILFEPATGPAAADRYVISLRYPSARSAADTLDGVELSLLALAPVAGGP